MFPRNVHAKGGDGDEKKMIMLTIIHTLTATIIIIKIFSIIPEARE